MLQRLVDKLHSTLVYQQCTTKLLPRPPRTRTVSFVSLAPYSAVVTYRMAYTRLAQTADIRIGRGGADRLGVGPGGGRSVGSSLLGQVPGDQLGLLIVGSRRRRGNATHQSTAARVALGVGAGAPPQSGTVPH